MSTDSAAGGLLTPLQAIVRGALAVGVLDYIFASTRAQLRGVAWYRVWKFVAGAIVGPEAAAAGGWGTVLFGSFLHFMVATCIVTVYVVASRYIPLLTRSYALCGLAYGAIAYFVINLVVIPSTRLRPRPFSLNWPDFLMHVFVIGLLAAYFASRATAPRE